MSIDRSKYKCKACLDNGCITWEAGGGSSTDACSNCDEGKYYTEHGETRSHTAYKQLLEKAASYPELAPLVKVLGTKGN